MKKRQSAGLPHLDSSNPTIGYKNPGCPSGHPGFLVRVTGFEPAASCSQSRRATNCATPGYEIAGGTMGNLRTSCIIHDGEGKSNQKLLTAAGEYCVGPFHDRTQRKKHRCA